MEDELNVEMKELKVIPDYNWGDQSYVSIDEKANLWNNEGRGKIKYHGTITSNDGFAEFYERMMHQKKIIYRGLNNAKYKIFTSLQVHYLRNKSIAVHPRDYVTNEINALKAVHGGLFPRYYQSIELGETDFLYLSLMQHYRAKTPFMDFTRSLDTSLFFAQDEYDYSLSNEDLQDSNNYISLFWIENPEEFYEFVDTIKMYADSLRNALKLIVTHYAQRPTENIDYGILKFENYLMWSGPQNRGEGFKDVELGLITDNRDINILHGYVYNDLLQQFVREAKANKIALESPRFNEYYEKFYILLLSKVKLTNLNIIAQDGCFILYNPQEPFIPMEEYWVKNPTYKILPQLHCIDIHNSLINSMILPMLNSKNISKSTIYPIEKDIVSSIVTV